MPERNSNSDKYRFGFNGKENDNEIKGTGNQQDYGMRIYDGRLGKFLSVDPLYKEYPWNSTYAFAENDVIRSIDLDGKEKLFVNNPNAYGAAINFLKIVNQDEVLKKTLLSDISKKELSDKVYIYFGVADIQAASGYTYSEKNIEHEAKYGQNIFKILGITDEEYKERKEKGIKQLAVIVDNQVPNKKQVKSIAHEIILHIKNRIKGIQKTIEKEHDDGYKPYYKESGEDPYYTPSDENVPVNSPQGKINKRIDEAAEKADNN